MKVVAFVPAKGSSERIQNKNLTILDGEYLFKRKLRQLLACSLIDEVVLDTDSEEIAELAKDLPVTRLVRPAELASNLTDGHELFFWECSQINADIYIQALCTAPFVDDDTVSRAISTLANSNDHDSLIAVSKTKQYTWIDSDPEYGRGRIPNSVDLPEVIVEAMSLYLIKQPVVETMKRFGQKPIMFSLTPTELIDVNWPEDLILAETIAAGKRAQENLSLNALTPYLSSAMISDITREMGFCLTLPQALKGSGRFFGRAKTLLLDKPEENESWEGIYDGLDTYQYIRPGDVIVVANRVENHAYFGNLNGQLAVRAGAVGAVIDGVTRDKAEVAQLGFSVYSRGHYCVDIKYEGVVRSMNKPITIGGVTIENNDFIFADHDGVTVIPHKMWAAVKSKLLLSIEKEWRVGMAVALGKAPRDILTNIGEF